MSDIRKWIMICEEDALSPADLLIREAKLLTTDGKITSWLEKQTDTSVEIHSIWSEVERGQGHATQFLKSLIALADKFGVTLTAIPHWLAYDPDENDPEYDRLIDLNDKKMNNQQLEAWYARYGFERTGEYDGDDPVIIRYPDSTQ